MRFHETKASDDRQIEAGDLAERFRRLTQAECHLEAALSRRAPLIEGRLAAWLQGPRIKAALSCFAFGLPPEMHSDVGSDGQLIILRTFRASRENEPGKNLENGLRVTLMRPSRALLEEADVLVTLA